MRNFILRAVRRNYGPDREYYRIVDDLFGFIPHNIELYKLALIHKSASLVLDDGRQINNERLEFLGDAVIEAVTSDYLYIEFADRQAGLSDAVALEDCLPSVAQCDCAHDRSGPSCDRLLERTNGNQKHIFGDAFEAMIGAIYLDMGYDFVNRLLINRIYYRYLDLDSLLDEETAFKSRLIEWCQKNHHSILFETVHGKGYSSNHPVFESTVLIDGICVGHGQGESKKEAEQHAASSVSNVAMNDETVGEILDKVDRLLQSNRGNVS